MTLRKKTPSLAPPLFPGMGDLVQSNVVFVSKAGNDADSRLKYNTPKLTIGSAIAKAITLTPAIDNPIAIFVEDGGLYSEVSIVVGDYMRLHMPYAAFEGEIQIDGEGMVDVAAHYSGGDATNMVQFLSGGENGIYKCGLFEERGKSLNYIDSYGIRIEANTDCSVDIARMSIAGSGFFFAGDSSAVTATIGKSLTNQDGACITQFNGNTNLAFLNINWHETGESAPAVLSVNTRVAVFVGGSINNELYISGSHVSESDIVTWLVADTNSLIFSTARFAGAIDYAGGTVNGLSPTQIANEDTPGLSPKSTGTSAKVLTDTPTVSYV